MQKLLTIAGLAAAIVSAADAQRSWTSEIGVQGGFSRLQAAGVGGDPVDGFYLPAFSLTTDLPAPGGLFLIAPVGQKLALEPSVGASQITVLGLTLSSVMLGMRLNYALTSKVYGALGGALSYAEASGTTNYQLGAQVALGYRLRLASSLNGRVEANWASFARTDNFPAFNSYSVLLGVSSPVGARARAAPARAQTRGLWRPMFGVQGGYANFHAAGQGGFAFLTAPGFGGALSTVVAPGLTVQPTLFAIIPLSPRLALEPGIDINRVQTGGTTVFAGNLSARLNRAWGPHWYAAGGANLQYYKATATDAITVPGVNLAGGYRFHLGGALDGRVEMNYTMMAKNDDLGFASQTFGLLFGVLMPVR